MARRIAAGVVALIALLLAIVAVPLGLITAAHDSRAFTGEAVSAATSLASVAEEKIADHSGGPALDADISQLRQGGDQIAVYDQAGRWFAGTPARPAVPAAAVGRALARLTPATYPAGDAMLVLAPVLLDETGSTVGVVAISRPTAPLEHRITVLWLSLGAVSVSGLLAAALLATALARWREVMFVQEREQISRDGAKARTPAHFATDNFVVHKIDDRLILKLKAASCDGLTDIQFQCAPCFNASIHFRLKEAVSSAPICFSAIHCQIGALQ